MRVPSAEASITNSLMNKVDTWTQPEQHWAKRHLLTRTVTTVATTAFAAIDATYNALSSVAKLPFAILKGTVGRINLPKIGKLNESMSDKLGMKEVARHVMKAAAFVLVALPSPVLGFLSPRANLRLHQALGLAERRAEQPVINKEADKAEDKEEVIAPVVPPIVDIGTEDSDSSDAADSDPVRPESEDVVAEEIVTEDRVPLDELVLPLGDSEVATEIASTDEAVVDDESSSDDSEDWSQLRGLFDDISDLDADEPAVAAEPISFGDGVDTDVSADDEQIAAERDVYAMMNQLFDGAAALGRKLIAPANDIRNILTFGRG